MEILWSKKAGETFQKNIDYLKENWTEKEVNKFVTRVFQVPPAHNFSAF